MYVDVVGCNVLLVGDCVVVLGDVVYCDVEVGCGVDYGWVLVV